MFLMTEEKLDDQEASVCNDNSHQTGSIPTGTKQRTHMLLLLLLILPSPGSSFYQPAFLPLRIMPDPQTVSR